MVVSITVKIDGETGLTAGLNNPPVMRKKTQAFTASEKPKARAMKSKLDVFGASEAVIAPGATKLATCVAEKAKNKNMKVPTNSPIPATSSFRTAFGRA